MGSGFLSRSVHLPAHASPLPLLSAFSTITSSSPLPTLRHFNGYIDSCIALLRQCSDRRSVSGGLAIHCHAVKIGTSSTSPFSSRLLLMYSAFGRIPDCHKILRETPAFDLVLWNYMMAACLRSGLLDWAKELFDEMPRRNDVSWTLMVDGHMKSGRVWDSVEYLERNPRPSVVSWTAAVSGFVQNGMGREGLEVFVRMLHSGVVPNEITFTSVLKGCYCLGDFDTAMSVVGFIVKSGFEKHLSVCNSLITLHLRMGMPASAIRVFEQMEERDVVSWTAVLDVYVGMGNLREARRLFDTMPMKNQVSWSTMIVKYSQDVDTTEACRLFDRMLREGVKPNTACFLGVLGASANTKNLDMGKNLHGLVTKMGLDEDEFIGISLISMYCKCRMSVEGCRLFDSMPDKSVACWNSLVSGYGFDGRVGEAMELFDRMPVRNIESWNAIISGLVENECLEKVFEVFNDMLSSGQLPNGTTFSSALLASASLCALEKGKTLHGKIVRLGLEDDIFTETALISMYAKSGDIESSREVFHRMPEKSEISWNAMIQGLADNGHAEESIQLFDEMRRKNLVPTAASFLSVLYACSHRGLVNEAMEYFRSMRKVQGIVPGQRHYACMVDVLARAGRLKEAERFINKMPIKAEASTWAALLSGCSVHGNKEIGENAANKVRELEEEKNSASYVLLSNIYASAGRWRDAMKTRELMREAGVKKSGGCSWISVKDQIHRFSSWDVGHYDAVEIYSTLQLLFSEMMTFDADFLILHRQLNS